MSADRLTNLLGQLQPALTSAQKPSALGVPVSPNQRVKNPNTVDPVRKQHHGGRNPMNVGEQEWKDRCEMAAAARALYMYGFGGDLAAQCIMGRCRDGSGSSLHNEWGLFFEETTASSLHKIDRYGNVICNKTGKVLGAPKPDVINMGCPPISDAIFKARPDVNAIIHIHPYAVMAVTNTEEGFQPCSQAAFFFKDQICRYKYEFSYGPEFEEDIGRAFAKGYRCMLLDFHGMYCVGRDFAEAFFVAFYVNQACEVQLRAKSMLASGIPARLPPPSDALVEQYKDMMKSPDYAYDGTREWPGILRKVMREHPDFNL